MPQDNQNINSEVVEATNVVPTTPKRKLKDYRLVIATICAFVVGLIALVTAFAIGQNTRFNSANTNTTSTQAQQMGSNSNANPDETETSSVTSESGSSVTKPVASTTSKAVATTKSVEMSVQFADFEPVNKYRITYPASVVDVGFEQSSQNNSGLAVWNEKGLDVNLTLSFIYESFDVGYESLGQFTKIENPNHANLYRGDIFAENGDVIASSRLYRQLVGTNRNCMGEFANFCMSDTVLIADAIQIIHCESTTGEDLNGAQLGWCDDLMGALKIEKIK